MAEAEWGRAVNLPEIEKLDGLWSIVSLEPGTCTERAAMHFAEHDFAQEPEIVYVPSFEEAEGIAKENERHILLLPQVHEIMPRISYTPGWKLYHEHMFWLSNPPLYLARGNGGSKKCATIPSIQALVADEGMEFVDAENTQRAAAMAASAECYYCITNEAGAQKHGLAIVKELKRMKILWFPFVYEGKD